MTPIPMIGIREYSGNGYVHLCDDEHGGSGRLVVRAMHDDNQVSIDLMDLIGWLRQNKDLVMGLRETP